MAMWNNPTVTGVEKRAGNLLGGFRAFVLRGNVVDLAVGIVIGAAFTSVVQAFVAGIITPLIPVSSNQTLSSLTVPIYHGGKLAIGALLNAVLSFLIVATVIYFLVVLPVNSLMASKYLGHRGPSRLPKRFVSFVSLVSLVSLVSVVSLGKLVQH